MMTDKISTAAEALEAARREGADVRLDSGGFVVSKSMHLSDATFDALKRHESEIVALLLDEERAEFMQRRELWGLDYVIIDKIG